MSIKSSFDTVLVEKAHDDPLQLLLDPSHIRKDLKGLSDLARKSFSALKPWRQAATWCVTIYVLCYALSQTPLLASMILSLH